MNRSAQSSIEVNNRHKYDNPFGDVLGNLAIMVDFIHSKSKSDHTSKWCRNRMLSQANCSNCLHIFSQLLVILESAHLVTSSSSKLIRQWGRECVLRRRETVEERRRRESKRHDQQKRRRIEILDVSYNDKVQREAETKAITSTLSSAEGGEMDTVESEDEEDYATGSNRQLNVHDLSRLLNTGSRNDCDLLLAFLLGMVFYPNIAIANRTWGL